MADFYSGWITPPNGGARYRVRLGLAVLSQNKTKNQSTVLWEMELQKDRSFNGFYNYANDYTVLINGVTAATAGAVLVPGAPWTGWSGYVIASGSQVVTHTADGTKTIVVNAAYEGHNTGWSPGNFGTGAQNYVLPTIAREATPVVTPNPVVHGSDVAVTWTTADPSFKVGLTWECGTLSGTVASVPATSPVIWTVPDAVMAEFPGQKLVPVTIIATTYKSDGVTVIGTQRVTIFAKEPVAAPSPYIHDPANQFDVRAKLVEWDVASSTWNRTTVLPAATVSMVDPASATTTCSITMSALLDDIPDYSVVDIEIWNGTDWVFTDHRFVLTRVEDDEVDPTVTKSYSGTEFIDYELSLGYVAYDYKWAGTKYISGTKDAPTPTRVRTTPGDIMAILMAAAQTRHWGPRIVVDFTAAKTSLGDKWVNTTVERDVSKGTPISQILEGLVTDGLVEYKTSYHDNNAYLTLMNPGTGQDFSADGSDPIVNLNLIPLSRSPRKGSIEKKITRVTVVGDGTVRATKELDPVDELDDIDRNVFGAREGWVAASGVVKNEVASTIAQKALDDNSSATAERTFEFSAENATPPFFPYWTYTPGDWVLIPDHDSTVKDRISQVTIDKQIDSRNLTILTGDRILSGTAKLAKRQNAQVGGAVAGGTMGTPATLDSQIPEGPVVSSMTSLGYWNTDGAAKSAVTITWGEVIAALNGSSISVDTYEVYERISGIGAEWKFLTSTDQLTVTVGGFDPLQALDFRVRAHSVAGIYGEFSEDQVITPLAPPVDIDGPDLADLYTDGVGNIFAVWGGTLAGAPAPARLAYVVAEVSADAGVTYTTMGTPIVAAGAIVVNPGAWGDFSVRLRGYDRLGNAGDVSSVSTITLTDPHVDPLRPTAPTGLSVTPGASWDASGFFATDWLDVSWTAPTLDLDGNPVNVIGYDVWGAEDSDPNPIKFLTSVPTPTARIGVVHGESWTFQVKAASDFGGVSDFSDAVSGNSNATITAPPTPDQPTLDQYAGILRIKWAGNQMQPYIKTVYALVSADNVTYTRAGMPLLGAGEVVVPGLAPGPYYAKIVMVAEDGQQTTSAAAGPITLLPITGVTYQTSPLANTGIKITDASFTAYNGSGVPTFILDAHTGAVWIAPYDAVINLGATGTVATTGAATTGVAISAASSSFNTFIHAAGLQIRNDHTALSWWEADATDASLVNFFSPRAVIRDRLLIGDHEFKRELKTTGTRLVVRYKGA